MKEGGRTDGPGIPTGTCSLELVDKARLLSG